MSFDPCPSAVQVAEAVLAATDAGQRIYTAVVTHSTGGDGIAGRRWWLAVGAHGCGSGADADSHAEQYANAAQQDDVSACMGGSLGDPALDHAVALAVREIFPERETSGAANREFEYRTSEGVAATASVYVELHAPPAKMVIVGAGHIAAPLARIASMLGLRVEVLDDRPEFADPARFPDVAAVRVIDFHDPFADTSLVSADHVVLVTRGHRFDYECLVRLLRMAPPPAYIGMIGSRRRVRATHEQLAREGFTIDEMKRVRAPVGLDLGGQSPAEIAVSVAAEIVMHRSGGTGAPLSDKERVVDRFFDGRTKSK